MQIDKKLSDFKEGSCFLVFSVGKRAERFICSNPCKVNENSLQIFIQSIIYFYGAFWPIEFVGGTIKVLRLNEFNATMFDGPNGCSINRKGIVPRTELSNLFNSRLCSNCISHEL